MLESLKSWRIIILLGFGVMALAAFLRLYNLNSIPVFVDEAIYVRWAQVMRAESTLRFLPMTDGKQPLFMWGVIPFQKFISDPVVAGRVLSALAGLVSVGGVFVLTQILFENKKVSITAAFFYAISPFTVFFDRMALVDAMLSMFGIWTLIFAIVTAKKLRLDTAMITGFTLGAALITKSPALFFVILLPSSILFVKWNKNSTKRLGSLLKYGFLLLVAWGIGYGIFNILRLGPNFHLLSSRNYDYVFPISHLWESPRDPFMPHFDRALEWMRMLGPWEILVLGLLGIMASFKKHKKEIAILLIWIFAPIAIQAEFAKVFTARYIYFSIPYLFILAALSIHLIKLNKRVKTWLAILIIIFIGHSMIIDVQLLTNPEAADLPRSERSGYLEEWTAGTGIREVGEFIRNEYLNNPDQKIVVGTEGFFGTLPDALQAYLNDLPEITVIGVGVELGSVPDSLIESAAASNKTYLVINSSRLNIEGEDLENNGLKIIKQYKKANRPDGFKEYVKNGSFDYLYLLTVTSL